VAREPRRQKKLVIPSDWVESDGYIAVAFCCPNSRAWRGLTRGLFTEFTSGRSWKRSSGSIQEAQAIGLIIQESLSMDCFDDLGRIADGIEALNITMGGGEVLTISEAVVRLATGTIDVQDSAALVETLGFLKELLGGGTEGDATVTVTMLMQAYSTWKFRESIVNLTEDIAISQRSQALAQGGPSSGLLYEGVDLFSSLATAGFDEVISFFKNRLLPRQMPFWATWVEALAGGILGNIRGATYDVAEAVEEKDLGVIGAAKLDELVLAIGSLNNDELAAVLADLGDTVSQGLGSINQTLGDCLCGGTSSGGGCCSCGEGGGLVLDPVEELLVECVPPDGFADFEEYKVYVCKAANFFAETAIGFVSAARSFHLFFASEVGEATALDRKSLEELYPVVSGGVDATLGGLWRSNMTTSQRAELNTALASRSYNFVTDKLQRVPEFDTLEEVADEWWGEPFQAVTDWMNSNKSALIDAVYNTAETGSDVYDLLSDFFSDAVSQGGLVGKELTELGEGILGNLASLGLANLRFVEAPFISAYNSTVPCVGDGGCVPCATTGDIDTDNGSHIVLGLEAGQFGVQFDNQSGEHCGTFYTVSNVQLVSGTFTPPGGINEAVRLYSVEPLPDSNGDRYNSNSLPVADVSGVAWVLFSSNTACVLEFDYLAD